MTEHSKPLVTFAVFAYNQERFIGDAVRSALSQSYSPLEIILSDDCSTDRTFERMEEIVNNFDGDHRVILRRNSQNLGIGKHVTDVFRMAQGKLVVVAAGDDVSLLNRTSILVKQWQKHNRPEAVYSNYQLIDQSWIGSPSLLECGYEPKSRLSSDFLTYEIYGCSAAYSKSLIDLCPDLSPGATFEDAAWDYRAKLVGQVLHVEAPLVLYRRHAGNISGQPRAYGGRNKVRQDIEKKENHLTKCFAWKVLLIDGMQRDLKFFHEEGIVNKNIFDSEMKRLSLDRECTELARDWWQLSLLSRLLGFRKYSLKCSDLNARKYLLKRLMPKKTFYFIKMAKSMLLLNRVESH